MIIKFLKLFFCVGLLRLNFGGSSSSLSNLVTNNYDQRQVLGEGAQYATNGATIVNQSLDAGMVHDAFAFGTAVTTTAMNDMVKVTDNAMNYSNDALTASLAASQQSARYAADAASDALAFAASAEAISSKNQNNAINTAADSMSQALAYSSKTTATALDSLSNTENLVKNAYEDAKGRGALTDKIMMVAIIGAGFVAWQAVKK